MSLADNRSAFLSSYFNQKVRKQRATSQSLSAHISKTSLRRIESYEEVLNRLKLSVMQVLAESKRGY